jgi:curved DNA-binding protein
MKGKGQPGFNGGQPGDLLITVHLAADPKYKLKGNDLYFDHELDLYTAILGGKLSVKTFDRTVMIDIPPSTDSHKVFRLRGMGIPFFDDNEKRGDAYVRMIINVPKHLSAKEKQLFGELKEIQRNK